MLRKYVTDRGKIKPRRVTGACTQHQRGHRECREARLRNGFDALRGSRRERPWRPPQPLGEGGTMKVILLKELKGRGGEGDVIEVANGYANNHLLNSGATPSRRPRATSSSSSSAAKGNIAKREETRLADAEAMRTKLDGAIVGVPPMREEGQLVIPTTSSTAADVIGRRTLASRSTVVVSSLATRSRLPASMLSLSPSIATSRPPLL